MTNMSGVRDLFFDEFYSELERVVGEIRNRDEKQPEAPLLAKEVARRWIYYSSNSEDRSETLISVDGGVQISDFAYGDFVVAGRACALIHRPGSDRGLEKRVKLYVGQVYDDRDRGFIPGYIRTICEYDVAYNAAKKVLHDGEKPLVLMDGSLYLSRFPYAIREYMHHTELLAELFESIYRLRQLSKDEGFPLVAVAKDSSVFYIYMELLKAALRDAGLGRIAEMADEASSPFDLKMKVEAWEEKEIREIEPFMEARPLCDSPLIHASTETEGHTLPLYLAPSTQYSKHEVASSLNRQIDRRLDPESGGRMKAALKSFFSSPGVAVIYWKPTAKGRPFRVDILSSSLGHPEAWDSHTRNMFLDTYPKANIEKILNHLGYWFCNEVEYNIPLKQADTLARFDRDLYRRKYEPFIVKRLEEAGLDVTGKRRVYREMSG